ncbi:uncharacterized protein [Onthophagus taurus]|uniref:uncharacterized protein isoform X1 n=1 Tax=Onthophagus taurus TaxID=166361 RepID=UPI0039BDD052
MDRTPKRYSKLSLKNNECINTKSATTSSSTPIQQKTSSLYDEYSPVFIPCTQEALDELDVVWDWNSPKSQVFPKRQKPKRLQAHSPIPIVKKYSHNQPVVNENLKNQLEKLKNQLETELKPSSSKSTAKIPVSKNNTKDVLPNTSTVDIGNTFLIKDELKELEDLFNDDSMEQELILQSQKFESLINLQLDDSGNNKTPFGVESKLEFRKFKSEDRLNTSDNRKGLRTKSNSSGDLYDSPLQKSSVSVKLETKFEAAFDDSFDMAMQTFRDSDLKLNNSRNNSLSLRSKSNVSLSMSFEENISVYDMQEIERKRQEALAKLRSKKLQYVISPSKRSGDNLQSTSETIPLKVPKVEESPIKCSPEEIEQKRLQALAKLEAKKKQDIIERNRREALKRLEMNKKKREKLLNNIRS